MIIIVVLWRKWSQKGNKQNGGKFSCQKWCKKFLLKTFISGPISLSLSQKQKKCLSSIPKCFPFFVSFVDDFQLGLSVHSFKKNKKSRGNLMWTFLTFTINIYICIESWKKNFFWKTHTHTRIMVLGQIPSLTSRFLISWNLVIEVQH